MYFDMKSYLKSTRNHTAKQAGKSIQIMKIHVFNNNNNNNNYTLTVLWKSTFSKFKICFYIAYFCH
jgi:hypothetical protein